MKYIEHQSLKEYFKIIFLTFKSIASIGAFFHKLINWYFNKKSLPFWGIFLMDCTLVFASFMLVYTQIHGWKDLLFYLGGISVSILTYLVFYIIGFRLFRTYSGILRYSSFVDLKKVGYAMAVGFVLSLGTYLLLSGEEDYRHITPVNIILSTLLGTCLLWMVRIGVKTIYDVSLRSINSKYAYIYGVKLGGIAIAKHIRNENPARFDLKGFISDDKTVEDKILMGVRVHKLDENLIQTMIDEGIEALIVSPYRKDAFRNNEQLIDDLIKAGIHIYVTQQAQEWDEVNNDDLMPQLKEISIEDLLPREELTIDMNSVGQQLKGKCIMITGSAGSIGQEIVRQICDFRPGQLILIDAAETPQHDIRLMMKNRWPDVQAHILVASICHKKHMNALFSKYHPDYVFHAAAYKHVPMLEDNPCESVHNNIYGTRVLADLAVKYGVKKFVMISTDKAVNPTNVMGCSKRICEIYVQSLDKAIKEGKVEGVTQFVTTRFGNVLGSNGSVIPLFEEQIKNGGPVTVTDREITRYFMLIPEACKLVLEAGTKGHGGEIFIFDMGKSVRIADLAKRMIQLSGAKGVEIAYTGLRQGEKLHEELLNVAETTKPSFHDKIRIASVREYDYEAVCKDIDELQAISETIDETATVRKMKQIVPEYKSNNSVYEKLDEAL
ncbi:MAG: polysaccharide biosynthesis protein [Prevotella sp.]|nr:polysaccharide biosynthesis protein [Prevotella sp.]